MNEESRELSTYLCLIGNGIALVALPFVEYCVRNRTLNISPLFRFKKGKIIPDAIYPEMRDLGSMVRLYESQDSYINAQGKSVHVEQVGSIYSTETNKQTLEHMITEYGINKEADAYTLKGDISKKEMSAQFFRLLRK